MDAVLDLAKQVDQTSEPKHISVLNGGFSSLAYEVAIPNNPFVLLFERENAASNANYGHTFVVLTLLERHGFVHAPRPLWVKDDLKAIAMSFAEGTPSHEFKFRQRRVSPKLLAVKVMDSLLDTASISLAEYQKLAAELNVVSSPVRTTQDEVKQFGTDWFTIVEQSCPDQAIIDWLRPKIEQSAQLAQQVGNHEPAFGHDDPSSGNILVQQDGSFTLIDWHSACFHTTGPEFFIAYTTHTTDFMRPYRQALILHVAERLGLSATELTERVHEFRRYTEVFDINWAAMMMAKVSSGKIVGDIDNFRNIAMERIAIYEKSF
ncbi:MAG: aminoglycoside phosphotransferase family protein [Candidatus Saccharibacteria bacterium]